MNQTGDNAIANIGTYNDVKGNQTNNITNTGLSEEQEAIAAIRRHHAQNSGGNEHQTCLENTRVQILQDIREWAEDATTTNRIFWLADHAGTGKSTVAKQIAKDWKGATKPVASFFFSINAADTMSNAKFCPTIAAQLANLESFPSTIAEALKKDPTVGTSDFDDQFEALLCAPLKKTNQPVLIIVDALDECDEKGRSKLLSVFLSKLTELPKVKVMITSRPEPDIADLLQKGDLVRSSNIQGNGDVESSAPDILQYVSHFFAQSTKLQSFRSYAPTVAKAANGLFIYASTACEYLKKSHDFHAALGTLDHLRGLDNLYSQIMKRAIPEDDPDSFQAVSSILQIILAAQRPLSISEMGGLLKRDNRDIQSVIKALASVLNSNSKDRPIEILHPTFREYLTDRSRSSAYFVDVKKGHESLAIGCLQALSEKTATSRNEVTSIISSTLEYAALHWINHSIAFSMVANGHKITMSLEDRILSLFEKDLIHWLELIVLLRAVSQCIQHLALLGTSHTIVSATATGPTSRRDERKRWCQDSRHFLQHHLSVVEQDSIHIRAALAFTPRKSLVYRAYFVTYAQQIPAVLCGIPTEWPSHQTLLGHTSSITSLAFSPDGTRIVSGSDDGTLRLWDGMTGTSIGKPSKGHASRVQSLAFSPDGTRIVSSSSDHTLRLWDGMTGASVGKPLKGHTNWIRSVAFSPDGTRIVSASDDHTLRLWDGMTGANVGEPLKGHIDLVTSMAFSPDGTRIVSSSDDHTLRLWDGMNGAGVGNPLKGHTDWVRSVAFSPDGTCIVSGSDDHTLRLWDAMTGASIGKPSKGHTNWVRSTAFSPDGTRIVSASGDGTLRLWDATTGASIGKTSKGHTNWVESVAFSPDGARIVSGSGDHTLRLWDGMTGISIGKPSTGHINRVGIVAFSPDGNRIVSGSDDHTLRLWDGMTGASIGKPPRGHTHWVRSVAFSPDGARIVSGSDDHTLQLWDVMTGASVSGPMKGHTGRIRSAAFSPDGTLIVSGSDDHTLRLWDGITGASIGKPWKGHADWIRTVAFSPDGTRIVSGSNDYTLRLWHVSSYALFGYWHLSSLAQVAVISTNFIVESAEFSACGSYLISQDQLWDIRSLPPSPVIGTKPVVSTPSSSPIRYNDTSRMIEVHTSSFRTFSVSRCQVHTWDAQGGRITLGLEDGRVIIIDCTHLL